MYEWLSKLETWKKFFQCGEPTEWSPQLILWLKRVSNPISRAIHFWFDSILKGYITEIAVDMIKSYSKAEREFLQGSQGHYLKYLKVWIKMLVREKGILRMESDE